jgi:hypothetical protein
MMKRRPLLVGLAVVLSSAIAISQGAASRTQPAAVTWYQADYAKFKPGMAEEARRIIYEHFWPVDREIGRHVIAFDFASGEWDHVVYIPLEGGPADLAVADPPSARRWRAAFARRAGSQERADALLRQWGEMVLREKREIVSSRTVMR